MSIRGAGPRSGKIHGMTEAIIALAGVALGSLLSWFGSWQLHKSADKRADRNEILSVVSEFMAQADRVWQLKQNLGYIVEEIMHSNPRDDDQSKLAADRTKAFEDMEEPSRLASWNLARIRILAPRLVPTAEQLWRQSSRAYLISGEPEHSEKHAAAQREFEDAARELLGVKDSVPPTVAARATGQELPPGMS